MNKKNPILSVKNLNIGYPNKLIANNISLSIHKKELTAIIGINGAGKSTFLKTITGDLPKKSGEIKVQNQALQQLSSKEIAAYISVVFSNAVFSQNLSVYEVVALGRNPYTNWLGLLNEEDKKAVQQALRLIEIENLANKKCNQLSDGQLQKVFIARALAQETDIIVLDEPTNHLDLYHKAFVFKLLKKLSQKTEKAIVFATHELNLALQLCDKIILINNEKAVINSPENLIKSKILQQLFPSDLIQFDELTKSFKVNTDF